ncbi:hypothetical protein Athai_17390 [Actinocatenispora thailandica]|uniref:ABC transporter permease n=1 Tax=Actinocatenispora thailandica TaxID=227318 RepID=A0A7R7HW10_9ACTN|nr:hypothetical protein Athai_17390 [Actinocatenispora thailandica]
MANTAPATELPAVQRPAPHRRRTALGAGLLVLGVAAIAALAAVDLTQGSAAVGLRDVWAALAGHAGATDTSVVAASRLPRTAAGVLVGVALGVAGGAMQSVSRNVLAAPDTLAVNAGAYLALGLVAVTGTAVPLLAQSGVAFAGGLVAAGAVLALSGPGGGTVRLVLAGSALTLGLGAVTQALLLLFPESTNGLYAWGQGSIGQNGFAGVTGLLPVIVVGTAGFLLVSRRLDVLALGDDTARSLGVRVAPTRTLTVALAVLLSAAAVTLAGPIGFVGLCAPALARPLARRFPLLHRSWAFLGVAGLTGTAVVLGSDVLLRAAVSGQDAVAIPTGVVTSVVGAAFLVALAIRSTDTGQAAQLPAGRLAGRRRTATVLIVLVAALCATLVAALLLGDAKLLSGDVLNWATGRAGRVVSFILDTRAPRVAAAVLAGAALALAGTVVQAVTRNPLADPGLLGVSSAAGLGAVLAVTAVPVIGSWGWPARRSPGRRSPPRWCSGSPPAAASGRTGWYWSVSGCRPGSPPASAWSSCSPTRSTRPRRSPGCPAPRTGAPSPTRYPWRWRWSPRSRSSCCAGASWTWSRSTRTPRGCSVSRWAAAGWCSSRCRYC